MSDEKKLKDLIRRLVAMTPEPPPFPEEVPMARNETSRQPRPALVFAGAAALVVALGVPLLLFFRASSPEVVATTTTVAPVTTDAPQQETTTTTDGSTATTAPTLSVWSQPVFLMQTPENSYLGNPAPVPFWIEVTDPSGALSTDAQFTDVLARLGDQLPDGTFNAIPPEVQMMSLDVGQAADGSDVLVADMNDAFLDGAGGLLADQTMLNQLVYTITFQTAYDHVLFTVGGQPVEAFGSEGIVLTDPVGLDDYIDELALIFLTDPIMEAENVYVVSGRANTYEAMLSLQVLDGNGDVVHEEPVQATCGTGCWGEFGVGVSIDLIEPGQSSIRLLTYSPEDGSAQNMVTVPVFEGDTWTTSLGG